MKQLSWMLFITFLVLLVLKATSVVLWSWWIVTSPLWLLPVLWLLFVAIALAWLTYVKSKQ